MKKRLLITSSLALALGLGVAGGLSLMKNTNNPATVKAEGTVSLNDQILISLKQSSWTDASVKTAVYFWGTDGDGWSGSYVADCTLYDSTNHLYIVDVPDGEWTNFKCVRVNPSSCPNVPGPTCWNQGVNWGESSNQVFGDHNTFEPLIGGGYYYDTTLSKFEGGTQIYLDLNGQDWTAASAHICIHIWGNTAGGTDGDYEMSNVHGWDNDNDHLWEVTIPGTGYWDGLLFFRGPTTSISDKWNQTSNVTGSTTNNVYKLSSYTSGSLDWSMSNEDRAACFGTYFLKEITCSGSGSITSPSTNWDLVKAEYNAMCPLAQGIVWLTNASETGTDLQKAMFRYDYIVLYKEYSGYDDFINRSGTSGAAFTPRANTLVIFNKESNTTLLLVVIISVLAAAGIGGYFFFRRKRHE